MKKTVLVIGANGFVGSHTLQALESMEVHVIALVRDAKKLPARYYGEIRQGDVRDEAFLKQALIGVDTVCACSAWTSAWGNAQASHTYFLQPTLQLLETAARSGVRRIVYPSSTTASVMQKWMQAGRRDVDRVWPHLGNVIRIEEHMKQLAARGISMVALRFGLFAGERYGLGMLPLLLPRLRTHLVPWVGKGRTAMPLIAGRDVGLAMALAATREGLDAYTCIDVVGKEIPTVREVFRFLKEAYGYPMPHFGVSFPVAYAFAKAMENLSYLTRWDPFITRSIILLLEETAANNANAVRLLGYEPHIHWQEAIRAQIAEMQRDRVAGMRMARAIPASFKTVI